MAEKLGLKIDDIVLTINGKPLKALTNQDAKLEIRQISVKRASQELQINFQK
jgi:C-terminal processing protease CtpA/Prc